MTSDSIAFPMYLSRLRHLSRCADARVGIFQAASFKPAGLCSAGTHNRTAEELPDPFGLGSVRVLAEDA
jgi:hypothetical protein